MSRRSGLLRRVEVVSPETPAEVIQLLSELPPPITMLAGGSKILARVQRGVWKPEGVVVDLSRIPDLRRLEVDNDILTIGACVTCDQLVRSEFRGPVHRFLAGAADFGPPAIRNRATVGGNVMAASANADLATALLALDASAVFLSSEGIRRLPLFSLLVGKGKTAAKPSELLTEIRVPLDPELVIARFERVQRRRAGRTTVSLAGVMLARGTQPTFRIAVDGAGTTAMRLFELERLLSNSSFDLEAIPVALKTLDSEITPPEDHLGTAAYRRRLVSRLLERFLRGL